MSYAAVKAYPKMKSTVFELPPVVEIADHFRPSIDECPNRENVTFIAGDFFNNDLPPADLYSLVTILHDWDENRIDLLLNKVFKSLPSGKLLPCTHSLLECFMFCVKTLANCHHALSPIYTY